MSPPTIAVTTRGPAMGRWNIPAMRAARRWWLRQSSQAAGMAQATATEAKPVRNAPMALRGSHAPMP